MRKASLNRYIGLSIILFIVLFMSIYIASGCHNKNDDQNISIAKSLPADEEILHSLVSSVNLPGANLVITDGLNIYFTSGSNSFSKTDADGQNLTIINEQPASWPLIADEQFFYAAGNNNGPLSKMKLDGSSHVRAGSGTLSNLVFYQGMIYAIEEPDRSLISIKTDGTGRNLLVDFPVSSFLLRGSSLYIAGKSAQDGIVRYDLRSNSYERIAETAAGNLQTDADYLYYADLQKQYHLYALDIGGFADQDEVGAADSGAAGNVADQTDSSDSEAVQNESSLSSSLVMEYSFDRQFAIFDQIIYFIDSGSQQQLFRIKLDNDKEISRDDAILTTDDAVDSFCLIGPYIYYRRAGINRLYRTDIFESRPIRIN